jgi:ATP-dependent RNA helicase RhlE
LKTFAEIDLIKPLQRALVTENYTVPTPIQAQTIPAALQGRDVLGCAQTGTGKTASFALPILNWLGRIDCEPIPHHPAALVLAPTRELAIQIGESFATYGRELQLRIAMVYGGVSQLNQVRTLKRGAHIVVATPGRLLDLMNQGHVDLKYLKMFVLDEADQMLNMGFLPDLKRIISKLPERRQSLFFSATLPPPIQELSKRLLRNPLHVNVTPPQSSLKTIEQRVLFVERNQKQALLSQILRDADVGRTLVFTRTKRGANVLAQKLERSGFAATAIHGNKSQNARIRALEAFRCNHVKVLVATDVAARGIDIDDITHVVNFDIPVEPESYVHRIGRTGRAGAAGIALSFCADDERNDLRAIEKLIGQRITVGSEKTEPLGPERPRQSRSTGTNPARRPNTSPPTRSSVANRQSQSRSSAVEHARNRAVASRAPQGAYSQQFDETDEIVSRDDTQKPKRQRRRRNRSLPGKPVRQTIY